MSADDDRGIQWRDLPGLHEAERSDVAAPAVTMAYSVYRQILAHVEGDLTRECAGLLFGRRMDRSGGKSGAEVAASRPVVIAKASLTHFVMHPETWPAVWDEILLEEFELVGWYHSHPGHGVFLSMTDRTTQALWFRQTWHTALVIDPVRREEAVFCGPEGVKGELVIDAA